MKIQYYSDLHLEFPENKMFIKNNPIKQYGDILILAGDIVPFKIMNEYEYFFDYISDNFKYTYWIPGNHEYYHNDIATKGNSINEKIRDNLFLVNNISVKHEDVKFIFSTLWSQINQSNSWQIQRGMSDFHIIKNNGIPFTTNHYNVIHKESLEFIIDELKNKSDKTVVATHHVPTFYHYPEEYKGSVLNSAFAVELYHLIEKSNIDYWIYGHSHNNTPDFTIGKTKLICNQLGYVKYDENKDFRNNKIIRF